MGILQDIGGAASAVGRAVGEGVEVGTNAVAAVLDDVGFHPLADSVDRAGDIVADRLGANVAEKRLGETDDPRELVHGNPSTITEKAGRLGRFADGFERTARALASIDAGDWAGDAADAFREVYSKHPGEWTRAADACADAATALTNYAGVVEWAQGRAGEAVAVYRAGLAASSAAAHAYNQQVDSYNHAVRAYNSSGGRGTPPTRPGPFVDPGIPLVEQAQALLSSARSQRNTAASDAASAIAGATGSAPAEPSVADRWKALAADTMAVEQYGKEHAFGGIVTGTADLLKTTRMLNPTDPSNLSHPGEYVATVTATAAGIYHDATHPVDLAKNSVGTGWGSDPFEAAGTLVPGIAAGAATGGGATAAGAAERAVIVDAERVAESAGRRVAEDVVETAVRPAAEAGPAAGSVPYDLPVPPWLQDHPPTSPPELHPPAPEAPVPGHPHGFGSLNLDPWAEPEPSAVGPYLPPADRAAFDDYTSHHFSEINDYYREPDSVTPDEAVELERRGQAVADALTKLPPHEGVVYRGTDLPDEILAKYQPGQTVVEDAFTSASIDKPFPGNTQFTIVSMSGREVAPYSLAPWENEVLFDRSTAFKVLTHDFIDGVHYIELIEVR